MHSVKADKQNPQLTFCWALRVLMAIHILITIYAILRMRPLVTLSLSQRNYLDVIVIFSQ